MRVLRIAATSLALSAIALTGCAYFRSSSPPPERASAQFITADEIARSGASNAWDLLRIRARAYEFTEDRYGRPRFIRTRRGRSTLNVAGADMPMIVIDGARLTDLVSLRDLSVGAIESVELLNGIAGTATQGTNASAGVIYIHTWEASQRSGG
jgi:outer membrane cobalamin receptor